MQKSIWDLKFGDRVETKNNGWAFFIGFLQEGFECEVDVYNLLSSTPMTVKSIIPVSDLILGLPDPVLDAPLSK